MVVTTKSRESTEYVYFKRFTKIFRIGRETIRYYEKIGIIHGKVNATKYHYYDDLDIENLARILKYREFKFPLQQIKKL